MRPKICDGALTAEQVLGVAQARCAACKHWKKTGEHSSHDCWRDPLYKALLGVGVYESEYSCRSVDSRTGSRCTLPNNHGGEHQRHIKGISQYLSWTNLG